MWGPSHSRHLLCLNSRPCWALWGTDLKCREKSMHTYKHKEKWILKKQGGNGGGTKRELRRERMSKGQCGPSREEGEKGRRCPVWGGGHQNGGTRAVPNTTEKGSQWSKWPCNPSDKNKILPRKGKTKAQSPELRKEQRKTWNQFGEEVLWIPCPFLCSSRVTSKV